MPSTSEAVVFSPTKAFNQSRVKLFLRCRQAYHYRYDYPTLEMGIKSGELVPKHSSLPLKKGDWMHQLLEAHWRYQSGLGKGWKKRHKKLTAEFGNLFEEERERYGDLPGECERMFRGYLRQWADDDDRFRIATLSDGKPAIEFVITVPLKKWDLKGSLKGRIDLMVEDLEYGKLWIRDAKWVKTIPDPDERMMSPQNIIYGWGLRELGYDIGGFIYDYGRTKEPGLPTILKRNSQYGPAGSVSLARCDTTYDTYLKCIKQAHGDEWKRFVKNRYRDKLEELKNRDVLWYRRERIPLDGPRMKQGFAEFIRACHAIEDRKEPIRTYLYNCKWNCDFHGLCVADFQGLDIEPMIRHGYVVEEERYGSEEVE